MEFNGRQWIHKLAAIWRVDFFVWCWPEQPVNIRVEFHVIWDVCIFFVVLTLVFCCDYCNIRSVARQIWYVLLTVILLCEWNENYTKFDNLSDHKNASISIYRKSWKSRYFDVFFDLRLDKLLSKQWWGWWFETPSHSLWRHCNGICIYYWNHYIALLR